MLKRGDIILTAFLLIIAMVLAGLFAFGHSAADTVEVLIDGKLYTSASLDTPQTITIDQQNRYAVIEIKDKQVRMVSANCPDKLCVKQGYISKAGQSIVCLPQKIVIVLKGNKTYDVITG